MYADYVAPGGISSACQARYFEIANFLLYKGRNYSSFEYPMQLVHVSNTFSEMFPHSRGICYTPSTKKKGQTFFSRKYLPRWANTVDFPAIGWWITFQGVKSAAFIQPKYNATCYNVRSDFQNVSCPVNDRLVEVVVSVLRTFVAAIYISTICTKGQSRET